VIGDDDRDARVADYVLGLMETRERERAFEAEMERDPSLKREVEAWRTRLAELDETATPEPLDESLWHRIDTDLGRPVETAGARRAGRRRGLWSDLQFWRSTSLAASAAALLLLAGTAALLLRPPPQPVLVAVLLADGSTAPGAVIEIGADGRARLLSLTAVPVPEGRALQIWTLPSREIGPVSVGLIDAARSVGLDLGDVPSPKEQQLFEITLEPASGSPTGRPTGPILYKGLAARPL
jgi:anti-sigma-K factor RskA